MAKKINSQFKILAPGGQATPAPPLGPALGAKGINPGQFIQKFNEATRQFNGKVVGCIVTLYDDRSFELEIKSSPASVLIKERAGLDKGSGLVGKETVGSITRAQAVEIAKEKMADLTAADLDAAVRIIMGTARSMGVKVEG
ncbi:MAG: 50S ribosomal protein L11 [Phycisphaerales bacterium]|nr:50S ribosomal protein L11 [Phycisphaerales bacterium]